MADERPLPDPDGLPQAVPRAPGSRLMQPIWIVPVVAILIAGWIAAKHVLQQGPNVTIQFQSAEGIESGKTRIKHKSVDIGVVRSIRLSKDLKAVLVTAELDRHAADRFLAEDTRFWIVRPRIAGGQVTGLTTLLAGSYIGADPGSSTNEKREFVGLESPPPVTSDLPGRQYTLRGEDLGSLDVNSPVYYRGVLAGRVVQADLAPDGKSVQVGVFVQAPYDRLVTADTRFWNASGIDATLDATGVKVNTQSLITVLLGGIAFETPPAEEGSPQAPVAEANHQFALWDSRIEALKPRETVVESYLLTFEQSVRGLNTGAPVDFRGVTVGEVRRIDLVYEREHNAFRSAVEINFFPERLRSRWRNPNGRWNGLSSQERMQRMVDGGLRAQMRSANLLTGQMYVALDFFPKAPKVKFDVARKPPEIPTVSGGLSELQESITNIVTKLEKVPFDQIAIDLRRALQSLDGTAKRAETLLTRLNDDVAPELRATLEDARKTIKSVDAAVSSDSPLQGNLNDTLTEVTRMSERLRELVDEIERHPESLIRGKRGKDHK
jgi:paraquat-inducible protein B